MSVGVILGVEGLWGRLCAERCSGCETAGALVGLTSAHPHSQGTFKLLLVTSER